MKDLILKRSKIGQFEKGVFANRDFKKGEIVVDYKDLKPLSEEEFENLSETERQFVHEHWGTSYLYPLPARYVNHSLNPNTRQDLKKRHDFAIRDIKLGEEITTDSTKDNI